MPSSTAAQAPIDRARKVIGFGHALAMGSESACDVGETALFTLTIRPQPGLERVGFRGNARRVNALNCRFHGLPAAVV